MKHKQKNIPVLHSVLGFCKNFCQQSFTLYSYPIQFGWSLAYGLQHLKYFSSRISLGRKWHLYSKPSAGKNYPDEERGGICQEHQWDAAEPPVPVPCLPLSHPGCSHRLHHLQHPQGGPGRSETLHFSLLHTNTIHPGSQWPLRTGFKKKRVWSLSFFSSNT